MKILLIEDTHFEVLYSITSVLLFREVTLFILLTPKLRESFNAYPEVINHPQVNFIVQDNPVANKEQANKMAELVREQSIDLLFVVTLQCNFAPFYQLIRKSKAFGAKSILSMHNLNTWMSPKVFMHPKKTLRALYRHRIAKVVDAYNVLMPNQVAYLNRFSRNKPVLWISSYALPLKDEAVPEAPVFRIVVPGIITNWRRNYKQLFQVLKRLKGYAGSFEVILLGRLEDRWPENAVQKVLYKISEATNGKYELHRHNSDMRILRSMLDELVEEQINISYYKEYVTEHEFKRVMMSADLILSPTKPFFYFDGHKETYGESKCSGNIQDMIKYQKPLMLPDAIEAPEDLKQAILFYSDADDMEAKLITLLKEASRQEELKKNTSVIGHVYSLQAQQQRVITDLKQLLN
jgi:hypothetical protein